MDKSQGFLPQYGLAPVGETGRRPGQVQSFDPLVPEFGDEASSKGLLDYWRIVLRYKVILLLFIVAGGTLGFLHCLTLTPIYLATTDLEIQGINENFMQGGEVNSGSFAPDDVFTLTEIMGSTTLMERVVKRLNLDESVSAPQPWEPSFVERAMGVLPPHPLTPLQRAARRVRGGVEITSAGQARIISIGYSSPDPEFAATFANTLADEFINYSLEMRWNSAQRTHNWLTEQLAEFKSQLQTSERELQAYARESSLMFTSGDASVSEDKLRQLQASLSAAHADRVTTQSQYELALSSPIEALPEVLDSDPVTSHRMRLAELRRELVQLESTLQPAHYKVKQIEAQIAEVSRSLEGERVKIADRIRNQYEAASRREKMLQADYERQTGLVTNEAQKSIQYNLLKRDVETNRQLYDGMLQRMKEASVMAAMKATNLRVIDPATPPTSPYAPNMTQQTALGIFTGMLFGFGFVVLREWGDRSLKTPGDMSFYLKLPELGLIPSARRVPKGMYGLSKLSLGPGVRKLLAQQSRMDNGKNGKQISLMEQGAQPSVELATWQQKTSLMAECYRAALTSILFSSQHGGSPQVIVLSSPNPGEGKTSTVSNLGIALAEIGRRVALIDGDMRRPRLHRIFGLPGGSRGLTDLLRSEKPIDQHSMESLAQATEVPGLYVLPGGSGAVNISNLLYSPRMQELLGRLKGEFDTILIDTPPMLQIPDARVLGRMADAVILVVRAGQTNRDSAVAASQRFAEDHTPVLGTILNGWDPRDSNAGFYDGYHEYYKSTAR